MTTNHPLLFAAAFAALLPASFAAAPSEADVSAARAAARLYQSAAATADFGAVYAALPKSWQRSLSASASAFASKADPGLVGDARDVIRQIAATAVKKSDLLAQMTGEEGSPLAGMLSEGDRRSAIVSYATKIAGVAGAATPERLSSGDLAGILAAAPLSMKGVTDAVSPISPSSSALAAAGQSDGSVRVSGLPSLPGIPDGSLSMVKREGVWVPKDLADVFANCAQWPAMAAAAKIPDQQVAQSRMALGLLKGAARQAASAQTADELRQYMTQATFPLLMLFGSMGGAGGGQGVPFPF